MKASAIILTGAILLAQSVFAADSTEKKLFTIEKSYNSENILLIHSQVDRDCRFVSNTNGFLDFYWLMNGTTKKTVNEMIRSKVQERVKFVGIASAHTSFKIRLNDLTEIQHDLEDNTLEVSSEINNGKCETKSIIKLGPSAQYRKLNLKRTFCEVKTNMVGVPSGCKYLELQGVDADNGTKLTVRFKGK